jgi:tetratricopeptide (TPR) repeat protein
MQKYNFNDSDGLFKEVLEKRPGDTRAILGLAVIDLDVDRSCNKAQEKAEKVLMQAPQNVPAHNLLARIDIENERLQEAIRRLQKHSLKVAPNDPDALILLGASYYLADDQAKFRKVEQRALGINSLFARFYSGVSMHVARVHRYQEAIELNEKALKIDRKHWQALANLGFGYSRIGNDAKAKDYLNKAFEGDPYNVRTYNLLEFFYDKVIKEFHWITTGPMKLRLHNTEERILKRYVPDLLLEAYRFFSEKYNFKPSQPLHVEFFHDSQLFSVRTVGLPRSLDPNGTSSGHVITVRSPRSGNFNWAEVLWRKLSQVFYIQLSKGRAPRWFIEGMAVVESIEGRKEWQLELDLELATYLEGRKLPGIQEFNLTFIRAQSFREHIIAYYHACLVAEFIAREFGSSKIHKMLIGWGQQKSTKQVFKEVLGINFARFNKRFFAWLDNRLSPLHKNFSIQHSRFAMNPDKWIKKAAVAKKNATAQARAAAAWIAKRDL